MYSPTIPIAKICNPPRSHIEKIMLVQPATVTPHIHWIRNISSIIILISTDMSPIKVIILIGLTLRDVIPSQARASIFFNGYLLSPARRSLRSYSTISLFKPIIGTIPRRKILTSLYSAKIFKARLLISLKSAWLKIVFAPSLFRIL